MRIGTPLLIVNLIFLRIISLEYTIKETYNLIETDEMINTMKLSSVSDDFRRQRIQEILEENLFSEKEQQIEKLNDTVAYLQVEVKKYDEELLRYK